MTEGPSLPRKEMNRTARPLIVKVMSAGKAHERRIPTLDEIRGPGPPAETAKALPGHAEAPADRGRTTR